MAETKDKPKLVRDNIPEIIKKDGGKFKSHIAKDSEYEKLLLLKLVEEVQEAVDSDGFDLAEELADVQEVINAIMKLKEIAPETVEKLRLDKFKERGGFDAKIVLDRW